MIALNRLALPLPAAIAICLLFWAAFIATLIALVKR